MSDKNPYKKHSCRYVYDYCDPEYCICRKSSEWERKNNPFHNWITYDIIKPPLGKEVLSYSEKFIHPDFNPNGIRMGFQDLEENDNGEFVTAVYDNNSDQYDSYKN